MSFILTRHPCSNCPRAPLQVGGQTIVALLGIVFRRWIEPHSSPNYASQTPRPHHSLSRENQRASHGPPLLFFSWRREIRAGCSDRIGFFEQLTQVSRRAAFEMIVVAARSGGFVGLLSFCRCLHLRFRFGGCFARSLEDLGARFRNYYRCFRRVAQILVSMVMSLEIS